MHNLVIQVLIALLVNFITFVITKVFKYLKNIPSYIWLIILFFIMFLLEIATYMLNTHNLIIAIKLILAIEEINFYYFLLLAMLSLTIFNFFLMSNAFYKLFKNK